MQPQPSHAFKTFSQQAMKSFPSVIADTDDISAELPALFLIAFIIPVIQLLAPYSLRKHNHLYSVSSTAPFGPPALKL